MTSSPPARVKRTRTSTLGPLRSKRGCRVCKIRRVKCGEEKPDCLRCTSTGRKCEYDSAILGTFSSAPATVSILESPLSPSPNATWRERRAFAYYFQYAAPSVGGLDVDFWSTIVPQVCRNESAVWDAIISISALFESPKPSSFDTNRRDALTWYSRSVSAVRARIERGGMDVFVGLISCVLFICIEALQEGIEEAVRLYGQGVKLILDLRTQVASGAISPSKASVLEETIVPIFGRLATVTLAPKTFSLDPLLREHRQLPTRGFLSLKSAREAIVLLAAEVQLFQASCEEHHETTSDHQVPPQLRAQQAVLLTRLTMWHSGLTTLIQSLSSTNILTPRQLSVGAPLLTHYEMLYVTLATCVSRFKTETDNYLLHFQNIIEQSRIALDASTRSDGSQPPFTFDIGVGLPLWFVALRCAGPQTRREAIDQLHRAPQVQGFYGSRMAATHAEGIMMLEENLACSINTTPGMPSHSHTTPEPQGSPATNHPPTPGSVTSIGSDRIVINMALPEEARIKPIGAFTPRQGLPPQLTNDDILKWNRSFDQTYLHFSRNKRNLVTGAWQIVHECVPFGPVAG
ncbi:hypothetical protein BJX99DRAFT_151494 [Aspergillus californicus]